MLMYKVYLYILKTQGKYLYITNLPKKVKGKNRQSDCTNSSLLKQKCEKRKKATSVGRKMQLSMKIIKGILKIQQKGEHYCMATQATFISVNISKLLTTEPFTRERSLSLAYSY